MNTKAAMALFARIDRRERKATKAREALTEACRAAAKADEVVRDRRATLTEIEGSIDVDSTALALVLVGDACFEQADMMRHAKVRIQTRLAPKIRVDSHVAEKIEKLSIDTSNQCTLHVKGEGTRIYPCVLEPEHEGECQRGPQ